MPGTKLAMSLGSLVGSGLSMDPKLQVLPSLSPPSETESRLFYLGLPSLPRLIGRASAGTDLWESPAEQYAREPALEGYQIAKKKVISNTGQHQIRSKWHEVQPLILQSIEEVPWTCIDVCRIGDPDLPRNERVVVVWIGIAPGNDDEAPVSWPVVAKLLRTCRVILDVAGLGDVDCQLRETRVVPLAGPQLLSPPTSVYTPWARLSQNITATIGQSVVPFDNPMLKGTLGVFLSTDNSERPLWGLTCRHVGLPCGQNKNELYQGPEDNEKKQIGLNLASEVEEWIEMLARLLKEQAGSTVATEVAEIHNTFKGFMAPEARALGHVFYSPRTGPGLTPFTWTRDWCLLSLDQSKFPGGVNPTNVVDLRTEMSSVTVEKRLNPDPKSTHIFKFPKDGLLRISGIIPLAEIRNPTTQNKDGDECGLVGKRGAATGLTWGAPLELGSTVRNCMPCGTVFISQEWAIYGSLPTKTVPFAACGDSGAAVFDTQGRLGGFLTRGTEPSLDRGVDISYATPAEIVLSDIEKQMGQKVVLL
ncbi:hypothetical protein F503_07715 [Ophiostoma piceae UAMH 11346]|uniref:Uncharacterized protein n=1 Tax=Ophiostoma piceae (strain UAMH 11346) TaxID=1262450 RepID=S3BSI4_OPHP1|nr:hypothetical protein F503_07715 [Ophiostoma piceae UAMH 11346]